MGRFGYAEGRPITLPLTSGQVANCTETNALTEGFGKKEIFLEDKGY